MSSKKSSNATSLIKYSLLLAIIMSTLINQIQAATDYPSPPAVPTRFENPQEVQKYLTQLHNYYLVVGRPRFGKRSFLGYKNTPFVSDLDNSNNDEDENNISINNNVAKLFQLIDLDGKFYYLFKTSLV